MCDIHPPAVLRTSIWPLLPPSGVTVTYQLHQWHPSSFWPPRPLWSFVGVQMQHFVVKARHQVRVWGFIGHDLGSAPHAAPPLGLPKAPQVVRFAKPESWQGLASDHVVVKYWRHLRGKWKLHETVPFETQFAELFPKLFSAVFCSVLFPLVEVFFFFLMPQRKTSRSNLWCGYPLLLCSCSRSTLFTILQSQGSC